MALTATLYNFDIDLADNDRGVYESLPLRIARHPSESPEYLVARVLAFLLEYTEGIEFSRSGLSAPEEPPIAVRDLTGRMIAWIDIGAPDATRLHKAAKAVPRVAIYTYKDMTQYRKQIGGEKVYNAEALELYAIDGTLVSAIAERLERRMAFSVSITDRELYVAMRNDNLTGAVVRVRLT